jgi:hypothetical protein
MPGPILHAGAVVSCAHQGVAQPTSPFPRVLVNGMPVAMMPPPWAVAGCVNPPQAGGPCVTALFNNPAKRVFVNVAVPVLLIDSIGMANNGLPVLAKSAQPRVIAQ